MKKRKPTRDCGMRRRDEERDPQAMSASSQYNGLMLYITGY